MDADDWSPHQLRCSTSVELKMIAQGNAKIQMVMDFRENRLWKSIEDIITNWPQSKALGNCRGCIRGAKHSKPHPDAAYF